MLTALILAASLSAPASSVPAPASAPAVSDPRITAGVRYYAEKKYPLALEKFHAAAKRRGANPLTYVAVCLTELHLGWNAKAGAALQDYAAEVRTRTKSGGSVAMTDLAIVSAPFILIGREPGRAELLKGLAVDMEKTAPRDVLGWELLGYYGLQTGEKSSLDAAAARVEALAPASALGPFFAAFSATLSGDRASARTDLTEAVRREPSFAAASAALAQVSGADAGSTQRSTRSLVLALVVLCAGAAVFVWRRRRGPRARRT